MVEQRRIGGDSVKAQMLRDALGYSIPQYFDEELGEFQALTRDAIKGMLREIVKEEMARDKLRRCQV